MSDYEKLLKTVNILTVFEVAFLVLAVICLIIAIVLFFKFKMPNVISEISGKKKQRQLEQMRINKQAVNNISFEVKQEVIKGGSSNQNKQKKRNGTVQKDEVEVVKRHETVLANNKRQTTVMDNTSSQNGQRKTHNTTVMEKKKSTDKKYNTLDETVMLHSDEIIE